MAGGPDPGEAGLVEPLGEVLTQLSKGGGAKGINIDDVSRQLEELTKKYPFQVPFSTAPPCPVTHHLTQGLKAALRLSSHRPFALHGYRWARVHLAACAGRISITQCWRVLAVVGELHIMCSW